MPWVAIMSQDSFYKELGPSELEAAHNNNYDFDAPDSIDIELLYGWLLSCCLMCIDVFGISHVSIQSKNRRVQPREAREGTVGVRCSFTSTQSRHHSLFLPPCSSRTTLETLSCSSRTTLETCSSRTTLETLSCSSRTTLETLYPCYFLCLAFFGPFHSSAPH